MFLNHVDAGNQLAAAHKNLKRTATMVLAVSDGGVPVGLQVAKQIQAQFSLIMVQKLPFPNYPNSEFGAIAEDDSMFLLPAAASTLTLDIIKSIVEEQKKEIKRRIKVLRGNQPLHKLSGENVILVSDGIASGSIIFAAINLCRKQAPMNIIVSSPVCSPEVARSLEQMSDVQETIILKRPKYFRRISQVYENWHEFSEHDVLEIMQHWHQHAV